MKIMVIIALGDHAYHAVLSIPTSSSHLVQYEQSRKILPIKKEKKNCMEENKCDVFHHLKTEGKM
jgi:hypothetical protein